ncbi:EF-hand domain-containing protein [Winogradskyella flava]|uniref:EF-hand domain-containing protein n=1 Tax=Winogradskyella flava TaxID=1884876 RepID=A0A842IRN6_9FLAO|nr:EF-hand domain-containing protein [Winogradskyella flava]MBC2845852.1 EF-hand domain-containing protein [Winogradskyella flava]
MSIKYFKTGLIAGVFSLVFMLGANAQENKGEKGRKERPTFAQLLEDMDANEDGKLSKDEIKGRLKNRFDKIDLNEDGFITEEEFKKAPRPKGRKRDN